MLIPDENAATIPELTHFSYRFYREDNKTYNEKQLEYMEKTELEEYVRISTTDSKNELVCSFHIVALDGTYLQFFIYTAKRIPETNYYLGDITPAHEDRLIGKFLVAYQDQKIQISIFYYEILLTDKDKQYQMESGLHNYNYYMLNSELLELQELGELVTTPDYSLYSGTWYRFSYMDSDRISLDSYITINITEQGTVTGFLQEMGVYTLDAAAEISGELKDGSGLVYYTDDGFGHSGKITILFYENGIRLYVVEQGEPDITTGFVPGFSTYLKQ